MKGKESKERNLAFKFWNKKNKTNKQKKKRKENIAENVLF